MNKAFTIYKSSAGSGKTYTLVTEYLQLALSSNKSDYYQHILAITFTNKATYEMKARILKYLKALANNDLGNGIATIQKRLCQELNISEKTLQLRAENTFKHILHHYGKFHISTIDKFVLNIVRSFSKELNLDHGFEIEMNTDSLLEVVVNEILEKIGTDEQLTKILNAFALQKTEDDKSWHIEKEINEIGKLVFNEEAKSSLGRIEKIPYQQFLDYQKEIRAEIRSIKNQIQEKAQTAHAFATNNFEADDFHHKTQGVHVFLKNVINSDLFKLPSDTLQTKISDKAIIKKTSNKINDNELVNNLIIQVEDLIELQNKHRSTYNYKTNILKNLYGIALLKEVKQVIEEKKSIHNFIPISEFNQKIHQIISKESIPFIYERIGEYYQHLMIDEFQDTSVLQWQNLLPIVENNLSKGLKNLVVGDAKQSIYRFRGGEVQQFIQLPQIYKAEDLPSIKEKENILIANAKTEILDKNYRSKGNIIRFNNLFFQLVKNQFNPIIQKVYEDVNQELVNDPDQGFVSVQSFEKLDDYQTEILTNVLNEIKSAFSRNYAPQDICILVNKNNEANIVAQFLTEKGISIFSNESFLVAEQTQIQLLVAGLQVIWQPKNASFCYQFIDLVSDFHNIDKNQRVDLHFELSQNLDIENAIQKLDLKFDIRAFLQLSIYDQVEKMINDLKLDTILDVYINQFLDFIYQNEDYTNNSIEKFNLIWTNSAGKLAVQLNDKVTAVKVLTIHKSKGLEFPIVFLPFAYNLSTQMGNFNLWHQDEAELIPINYISNKTDKQEITEASEEEKALIQLDILNKIYVAFTRPVNELYIYSQQGKTSRTSGILLDQDIVQLFLELHDGEKHFELGERTFNKEAHLIPNKPYNKKFSYGSWKNKVSLSSQQKPFKLDNEGITFNRDDRSEGNVIHQLLSLAHRNPNLDQIIFKGLQTKIIRPDELNYFKPIIDKVINDAQLSFYFDFTGIIKNEQSFLYQGKRLVADKLLIENNQCYILDYKSGAPDKKHHEQLKQYTIALENLGLSVVTAHLYYISDAKLVEIKKEGQIPLF